MNFAEFIAAITIALFFTLLLALAARVKGPWGSFWSIFLVILLGVWAASLWISPVGPVYWNIAWIPLFFVGLILALVLAAATPPTHKQRRFGIKEKRIDEDLTTHQKEQLAMAAISAFFWILLIILLITIIIGYMV